MRDKHRYILVESSCEVAEADRERFSSGLYSGLLQCIGEANYHRVNPRVMDFVGSRRFIIRSMLDGCGLTVAALAMIKKVNGDDVYFYTLKCSGTMKALGSV